MTPPLVALGAPTGGCNGSGGAPGCCPLPPMPPHPVPTHLQPSAWRRCCSWEPSGAGACRGCGAAPAGGRWQRPPRCSGAACLGAEPWWGAQGRSEPLMLPPHHPFPGHPPTQHRGDVWGGGWGWQGLTCAAAGGPPGEPLAQLHLHAAHEPVDVLGGAVAWLLQQVGERPGRGRGTSGLTRCLRPPSRPTVPPPAPRHVQRGHFEAGQTPRRGWARGARAAAGRRLHRWLWRTCCRSRRPPCTRQHETLNAITQGTALPRSASHTSLCGWAAPRGCGVALLGELQKPPGRGPGQPAPGPAGAGGLQPRLPTSAVT